LVLDTYVKRVATAAIAGSRFELYCGPIRRPTNGKARAPGGDKGEQEGQPGPEYALEHFEASLDEECDDKDVYDDHDTKKCGGGMEWWP